MVCVFPLACLQTPPFKSRLQMVSCIPVGDETGHEMGYTFLAAGASFKNETAPMITQDTVFVACMYHVFFVCLPISKKNVTHILKLSSPVASGGKISHPSIQEQSFDSVEIKGTGSLQQTFEVSDSQRGLESQTTSQR